MGTVYRARDERLERDVAVKLLRVADDHRQQERFQREARFLAGIQHPNLVTAFDTGADSAAAGSVVWLVMELVAGPDLGALLERRGPLPSEDVRIVVRDVAAALGALHEAGVVHRDLKPANILLTAEPGPAPWRAKVADLGIAHILEAEHLTTTGQVLGTAPYLSPEQVSGDTIDTASDVYSLGLLALEALTGERAFPGSAAESAMARLVRPPALPPWIDGGWRMLLESMTALDPRSRPTAAQVEWATAAPLPALVPATTPAAAPSPWSDAPTMPADLAPTLPLRVQSARPRSRTVGLAVAALTAVALAGGAVAVSGAARQDPVRPSTSAVAVVPHAPSPSATTRPTSVPVSVKSSPVSRPAAPKKAAVRVAPRPKAKGEKGKKEWGGHGHGRGDG